MEIAGPRRPFRRNTVGKGCHTVFPVPFRQMLQIVVHGVITLDIVRIHIATDILIPTADALFQGTHGDRVACLFGEVLE